MIGIRKLNLLEVITIYYRHLYHDFPRNERRPLFLVLKGLSGGNYECLGATLNGKVVGYAYFVKHGDEL